MRRDPLTGFGDETNTSVKFQLVADRGIMPDWETPARIAQLPIVHGGTVTQYGGMQEATLEAKLLFDRIEDYDIFRSLQGQQATLRYVAGITDDLDGTRVAGPGGTLYLTLPDTLLKSVTKGRRRRNAPSECTAVFGRTIAPSAYYGFALYSEPEE